MPSSQLIEKSLNERSRYVIEGLAEDSKFHNKRVTSATTEVRWERMTG
jgi:hypothetical protein